MRLALLFLLFLAGPALAAIGWTSYENSRFGFRGAVPAGFSGYGEDESGVGQIFDQQPTMQVLSYFGETLDGRDFGSVVATTLVNLEQQGWNMSYQAVTPEWADITAIMGKRRVHMRLILLCDRESFAFMTLQYGAAQAADIKSLAAELEDRFVPTGC